MLREVSETVVQRGRKGPLFANRNGQAAIVNLMDIGLFARGMPHTQFELLRRTAPVYWHDEAGDNEGFWALTTYNDVLGVGRNPLLFSNQIGGHQISHAAPGGRMERLWAASMNNLINLDAAPHIELRRQHMPFFTPAYVADLRKKVAQKIETLVEAMAQLGGECDLVPTFSAELPLFTLSEMLGVPMADRPKLAEWMEYIELAQVFQSNRLSPEEKEKYADFGARFVEKMNEMLDFGAFMIKSRRDDPKADLFTAIAKAVVEGDVLSDGYVDGSWLLILNAGNDTTRNTISGSVQLFTDNPDQLALLRSDESLIPNAVDEALRLVSPVIHMRRTVTADTEIGGQRIAKGEKVVVWYPSANRDETVFAEPHRFDIRRANAGKHLAFGYGPHVCLGQRIANMQLEEVYKQLFARYPDIRVAGPVDVAPNNFTYGIRHMPVAYRVS